VIHITKNNSNPNLPERVTLKRQNKKKGRPLKNSKPSTNQILQFHAVELVNHEKHIEENSYDIQKAYIELHDENQTLETAFKRTINLLQKNVDKHNDELRRIWKQIADLRPKKYHATQTYQKKRYYENYYE